LRLNILSDISNKENYNKIGEGLNKIMPSINTGFDSLNNDDKNIECIKFLLSKKVLGDNKKDTIISNYRDRILTGLY
jgi:uncharacterized metal-binding protein